MKIEPQFIIICRDAFLQEGTNNLNLIGVFSQINTPHVPFVFPRFAIVINFTVDHAGDHMLQTDLFDPQQQRVSHSEVPIRTSTGNWQVITNYELLRFPSFGTYTFHFAIDGRALGTRTLELTTQRAPTITSKPTLA